MMPRKKSNPIISPFAFGIADMNGLARDATYVVKWDAPLAISWMEGIAGRLISETEKKAYNDSAIKINKYLDHLETMRYYDKKAVWGALVPTRVPEIF
jgi:hypothetical protein